MASILGLGIAGSFLVGVLAWEVDPLLLLFVTGSISVVMVSLVIPEFVLVVYAMVGTGQGRSLGMSIPFGYPFVLLVGAWWVALAHISVRSRKPRLPPAYFILGAIAFVSFALISLFYTPSPHYGQEKLLRFAIMDLSVAFLVPLLLDDESSIRVALLILVSLSCFLGIAGLATTFLRGGRQVTFLGVDPISFGMLMSIASLLSVVLSQDLKRYVGRLLAAGVQIFLFTATFLTNSRGAVLSLIVGVGLFFIISRRQKLAWNKRFRIVVAVPLLAAILAFLVLPGKYTVRLVAFVRASLSAAQTGEVAPLARLRGTLMEAAIQHLPHYLPGGVGIGGFSYLFTGSDRRLYPHNYFLEVLLETGIHGFLAMSVICIHPLRRAAILLRRRPDLSYPKRRLLVAALLAATVILLHAQLSGDLASHRRLWFFIGILFAVSRIAHRK